MGGTDGACSSLSYISSANCMVCSRVGLCCLSLAVIFSTMSIKLTPKVLSRSAEYMFLALQSFLLRTCWLKSCRQQAERLDSSRVISSMSIPSSNTAHFSSSTMQKSCNFSGEQFTPYTKVYLFSYPITYGSITFIAPSSSTRMLSADRKIVLNCLRSGLIDRLAASRTSHIALRQLYRMLHKSWQVKQCSGVRQPEWVGVRQLGWSGVGWGAGWASLRVRTSISVAMVMGECWKMRWVRKVWVQKFQRRSSMISTSCAISTLCCICAWQLRKWWSLWVCSSCELVLQVLSRYLVDPSCLLESILSPCCRLSQLQLWMRVFGGWDAPIDLNFISKRLNLISKRYKFQFAISYNTITRPANNHQSYEYLKIPFKQQHPLHACTSAALVGSNQHQASCAVINELVPQMSQQHR